MYLLPSIRFISTRSLREGSTWIVAFSVSMTNFFGSTTVVASIADEILRLRDQRRQAEVDSVIKDEQMKQIREMQDFVKKQPATITEFDETLVSRLIEKITVFEDHFTVDFKSGITIDIKA